MKAPRYDVIIVGVGGMGSAALYHLARRGLRVLGLERFGIPNEMGSSHGVTRIIRLAYYEHTSYVPLLRRAYELWRDLETRSGQRLLHITGSVDAGLPGSMVFEGSFQSCLDHDLPHEVLTGTELHRRFPGYRMPADSLALFQPEGGFLIPELCIETHVGAAQALGADVAVGERVLGWNVRGDGVEVHTESETYRADRLVLTAGSWMAKLVPILSSTPGPLGSLAIPERQVLVWLDPFNPQLFTPERFPVFNCTVEEGRFYGFPVFGVPGFKLGRYHHLSQVADPDTIDRDVHAEDEAILRDFAARYFPEGAGTTLMHKVCMFTNSPDEHFILDLLPDTDRVTIAAGFSGHGFKFCSVVGEILADLSTTGQTTHDIDFLRLRRFLS